MIDNYNCNFSILANAGFPSGIKSYAERINQNLVYPPAAIKNNIEGTVTVEFSVERNGDVVRPKIINGLGYGCDEAAINAILKGPRCSPGVANGRPIALTYQIDVTFKLEDQASPKTFLKNISAPCQFKIRESRIVRAFENLYQRRKERLKF